MANLSTKELTALEDQMGTEKMLVNKYRAMATQCQDTVIRNRLEQIAGQHQRHFDQIAGFLR